ncbi:NACHT domain-containing protein [Streptomyces sp. NPDC055287]
MWAPLGESRIQRRVGLGLACLALVALAVALSRNRGDSDAASMWISAVSAFVAVCAFAVDFVRGSADTDPGPQGDRRQRAADALAEAVREQWTAEAQLRRLQDPEPLGVHWSRVGPPLADHRRNVRQGQGQGQGQWEWQGRLLPAPRDGARRPVRIVEAFTAIPSGRLVVLGGPGAGKTILAVQFVLGVLAARQPGGPVPVFISLANWDPRSVGLREWLAERLAAEYRPLATASRTGTGTLARELVDAGLVLPVLDGLDELPGPARVKAVRRLNSELGERLAVLLTCRSADWEQAVRDGDVLTSAEVVRLRPPDFSAVRTYLERTAPPGADGSTRWTPILRRPSAQLTEALRTPLMVALARTVYGDRSDDPAELLDSERFPTAERIEEHLLDAFVPASFGDEPDDGRTGGPGSGPGSHSWPPEAAHRWLCHFARDLERRGTGRLAWWELGDAMPRVLRVVGPACFTLLATVALLSPLVRYGDRLAADWDTGLSVVMHLTGFLLGTCFGLAFLLPPTERSRQGLRPLLRLAGTVIAAFAVTGAGLGLLAPPIFGVALGMVRTPELTHLLNGLNTGVLFPLIFAVAGLPRRPLPLSLPWAGSPRAQAAVRLVGGAFACGGVGLFVSSLAGADSDAVWRLLPPVTCLVAGLFLYRAGLRRAERQAGVHGAHHRVLSRFGTGMARGFCVCLLVGVSAFTVMGAVVGAFAAYELGAAKAPADGEVIGGWRADTTDGGRALTSLGRYRGELLYREGVTRPLAVPVGAGFGRYGQPHHPFYEVIRVRTENGQPMLRTADGRAADVRNVVLGMPGRAQLWLARRDAADIVADSVMPLAGIGVLFGVVGGCASGVYRALNMSSDVIRSTGPRSTLRTDRSATFVRAAIVSVVAGGVCLVLISALGRDGFPATVHTQLWLPLGTSALALSAWGRLGVTRIWLAVTGRAPWRLMGFLEEAHRRGVLRQSGAHYEFRHLRLQQRLAGARDRTGVPRDPSLIP